MKRLKMGPDHNDLNILLFGQRIYRCARSPLRCFKRRKRVLMCQDENSELWISVLMLATPFGTFL